MLTCKVNAGNEKFLKSSAFNKTSWNYIVKNKNDSVKKFYFTALSYDTVSSPTNLVVENTTQYHAIENTTRILYARTETENYESRDLACMYAWV